MEEITNICTQNKVELELMDESTIPCPNEDTRPISEFKQERKTEVFLFGDLKDLEPPASTNQMKPEHNEEGKHKSIEEIKMDEFEELMLSRTIEDPMPDFKEEIITEEEPIGDNEDAELVASASQCPKMTYEIETNGCSGRRTECDAASTCDVILGVGLTSDIASNSVQKSNLCTMCNKAFKTKYNLAKRIKPNIDSGFSVSIMSVYANNELASDISRWSKDIPQLTEALCNLKKEDVEKMREISEMIRNEMKNSSPSKKKNKKLNETCDRKISVQAKIKGALLGLYHTFKDIEGMPLFEMEFKKIFEMNLQLVETGLKGLDVQHSYKEMEKFSTQFETLTLLPKYVNALISYLVKLENSSEGEKLLKLNIGAATYYHNIQFYNLISKYPLLLLLKLSYTTIKDNIAFIIDFIEKNSEFDDLPIILGNPSKLKFSFNSEIYEFKVEKEILNKDIAMIEKISMPKKSEKLQDEIEEKSKVSTKKTSKNQI